MARPKEFDVDDALASALQVFWQKGYEATSMQDLVDAMGIQKASLYGTFGDKHSLYTAALRSYQQQSLRTMDEKLASSPPKAALRSLVLGIAEQACGRAGKMGCFCVNANIEMAPHDAEITSLLREHSEQVEAIFERTLRAAKAQGGLPRGADCKELASFVFGIVMALNVLGKQGASRARMLAVANHGLAALDA